MTLYRRETRKTADGCYSETAAVLRIRSRHMSFANSDAMRASDLIRSGRKSRGI